MLLVIVQYLITAGLLYFLKSRHNKKNRFNDCSHNESGTHVASFFQAMEYDNIT